MNYKDNYNSILDTLKPIQRICKYCKQEFLGSKSFCSQGCIDSWKYEGQFDLWRKYFYPPYQPVIRPTGAIFYMDSLENKDNEYNYDDLKDQVF